MGGVAHTQPTAVNRVLPVPLLAVFGDIGEVEEPLPGLPVRLEGGGHIVNGAIVDDQCTPDQRTPPPTPPCPRASRQCGKIGGLAEMMADGATATQQSIRGGVRTTTIFPPGRALS